MMTRVGIEEHLMRSGKVVFPQGSVCSDPEFKPLPATYQEWEQEQMFHNPYHNHTIVQTMRKNANMVLRCLGMVDITYSQAQDLQSGTNFHIRKPKSENFTILVYPKGNASVPHFDGIIPITVGAKC